jgi:hypothetical protein
MSSRKTNLYIEDIRQACQDMLTFMQTMDSATEPQDDRRTYLVVVRCLEVIGEAVRQTPKSFRDRNFQVPWRERRPACGTSSRTSILDWTSTSFGILFRPKFLHCLKRSKVSAWNRTARPIQ